MHALHTPAPSAPEVGIGDFPRHRPHILGICLRRRPPPSEAQEGDCPGLRCQPGNWGPGHVSKLEIVWRPRHCSSLKLRPKHTCILYTMYINTYNICIYVYMCILHALQCEQASKCLKAYIVCGRSMATTRIASRVWNQSAYLV